MNLTKDWFQKFIQFSIITLDQSFWCVSYETIIKTLLICLWNTSQKFIHWIHTKPMSFYVVISIFERWGHRFCLAFCTFSAFHTSGWLRSHSVISCGHFVFNFKTKFKYFLKIKSKYKNYFRNSKPKKVHLKKSKNLISEVVSSHRLNIFHSSNLL
jgi:hypothetical protein